MSDSARDGSTTWSVAAANAGETGDARLAGRRRRLSRELVGELLERTRLLGRGDDGHRDAQLFDPAGEVVAQPLGPLLPERGDDHVVVGPVREHLPDRLERVRAAEQAVGGRAPRPSRSRRLVGWSRTSSPGSTPGLDVRDQPAKRRGEGRRRGASTAWRRVGADAFEWVEGGARARVLRRRDHLHAPEEEVRVAAERPAQPGRRAGLPVARHHAARGTSPLKQFADQSRRRRRRRPANGRAAPVFRHSERRGAEAPSRSVSLTTSPAAASRTRGGERVIGHETEARERGVAEHAVERRGAGRLRSGKQPGAQSCEARSPMTPAGDTGLPQQDAEPTSRGAPPPRASQDRVPPAVRARRRSVMLPFEEVVAALGPPQRARPRRADDPAGLDRRHRRPPARRVRPRASGPPPPACAPAGRGSRPPAGAARRCRRSTSTASASCTSSRTATTACRSPARTATRTSRPTSSEVRDRGRRRPRAHAARPPLKRHERVFRERVPLPRRLRDRIQLRDEWRYAQLATRSRPGAARQPRARAAPLARRDRRGVVPRGVRAGRRGLGEAGIGGEGTETERYLRIAMLRSCCCRPTSGPTRSSSSCSARSALPRPMTTRWCTRSSRRWSEPAGRCVAPSRGKGGVPAAPDRFAKP